MLLTTQQFSIPCIPTSHAMIHTMSWQACVFCHALLHPAFLLNLQPVRQPFRGKL